MQPLSETQMLTIALSTFPTALLVLAGILINNSRLGDFKDRVSDLKERLDDLKDVLRAEMAKNQSELLAKFAEMDHRIEKLEQQRWKP